MFEEAFLGFPSSWEGNGRVRYNFRVGPLDQKFSTPLQVEGTGGNESSTKWRKRSLLVCIELFRTRKGGSPDKVRYRLEFIHRTRDSASGDQKLKRGERLGMGGQQGG